MNGSHDWWITPTVTALVIGLVLATPAVAASPGEERAKAHAKFVEERGIHKVSSVQNQIGPLQVGYQALRQCAGAPR